MTSGVSGPATVAYASRDVISGRSDIDVLRASAIAAGISWSVLFVVIGLRYELQMYADGSDPTYDRSGSDASEAIRLGREPMFAVPPKAD